uniref:Uncharacterized protein n=1 Tax=Cucumis sativus TaxID=3659 RepID=A0A0A0KDR8_CUCSA
MLFLLIGIRCKANTAADVLSVLRNCLFDKKSGVVSGKVALLPRSTEIQPFVDPIQIKSQGSYQCSIIHVSSLDYRAEMLNDLKLLKICEGSLVHPVFLLLIPLSRFSFSEL